MKLTSATSAVVDKIIAFNRDRIPKLVRLKFQKMAQSPLSFFRGADHLFAIHWSHLSPPAVGPSILISGDLHVENFGAYRTDEGEFLYDINDFDEALVAPCSLDLVRCTTSIFLAAQEWHFSPVQAMRTVLTFLDRYRATVKKSVKTGHVGEIALGTARGPIWGLLKKPMRGEQGKFLDQFTVVSKSGERRIHHESGRFRPISGDEFDQIRQAVEKYGKTEQFEVLDIAFRIAGTGSLGLQRYAVLVRGGGSPDRNWLLDIKEARESALSPCATKSPEFKNMSEATRVVLAERQLQAKPTARLDVIKMEQGDYRIRELIPEENRTGLDTLRKRPRKLRRAVAVAGRLTAWAHVRGSRIHGHDHGAELARWADGPGLDAVIASAVRYAEISRRDHKTFSRAIRHKHAIEAGAH